MVKAFGGESAFLDDSAVSVGDPQARRDANRVDLTAEETYLLPRSVIERELTPRKIPR